MNNCGCEKDYHPCSALPNREGDTAVGGVVGSSLAVILCFDRKVTQKLQYISQKLQITHKMKPFCYYETTERGWEYEKAIPIF